MRNYKSNFFGDKGTSSSNLEVIQKWKEVQTNNNISAVSFNFIPSQDCTIIINGSHPIPFLANQPFVIDTSGANPTHKPIWQFQIVEAGIDYWYMGILKD